MLVAGSSASLCGYGTTSLERLWLIDTLYGVSAVCMLGSQVLVKVAFNPALVLDRNTGAQVVILQKVEGWIHGLGVIEGLCFVLS